MKTTRFPFFYFQCFVKSVGAIKKTVQGACLVVGFLPTYAQEVKMYTGCNMVLTGNIYVVVNNTAFKNNGVFAAGTSTVKFTGNTDTSIAYLSGSSNTTFNNLTLDKSLYGVAVKSPVGVKNVLTLSAGKFYSNSNLTLLSDVANTARLAAVPAGAYIYGNAMVERYIPSKRAWRLMTAPVTNGASIYNSWQNGGVYTVGKGLLISGQGGSNGLDNANANSLKKWDASSQTFLPVLNTLVSTSGTNNGSADNIGYFVFIRGDRNPTNFSISNTNITTITSIGGLQTGVQTFNAAPTGGAYTLIGNPYASPVDFNAVTRINLLKRFYVWDPTLNSLGGYVTVDDLDNDGNYTKSVAGSAQTKEIQSSQAFFVETNGTGAASLTIDEGAKSTTNNSNVFRPVGTGALSGTTASMVANLFLLDPDNSLVLADGALAEFAAGYSENVTNEDALKFTNTNENIGYNRNGVILSIERRPLININDTLFFRIWKTTQRSYQLQLIPQNLGQPGLMAYLEDSFLATSTPISLSGATAVNFTVNANAASAGASRFRIVFKQLTVLPVSFTGVKAHRLDEDIQVDWQVQDETGQPRYEVEKSATGSAFKLVANTAANATGAYSWTDVLPFPGNNFYRIKSIARNGSATYSPIVKVQIETKAPYFLVYPNPVKGRTIHLEFANQTKGNYQFNLMNSNGQLVFSTQVPLISGSSSQDLKTNSTLPSGLYQLRITGPGKNIETQKVLIQQ